jgi:Uma2 family endonuclease
MEQKEDPMSLPLLRHPGYTLEEWASWEGRWELIDGIAYDMTPSPNLDHQEISVNLTVALHAALAARERQGSGSGHCQVLAAPLDVFLPSGVLEPDLVVVCDPAKKSVRGIEGAPDLVVEILSPGTASKDLSIKRWAYEAAGVPEYLIIFPLERFALLLRLDPAQHYQEAERVAWGGMLALLGGTISVPLGT